MLPVTHVTGCAPDRCAMAFFTIEFSKIVPTPEVAPGAVCGEVYHHSPKSVNTQISRSVDVARATGFEPATCGFGDRRSTGLSYARVQNYATVSGKCQPRCWRSAAVP